MSAIRERGPLTVAEYMELALYGEHGYYSTAVRRSGRGGDFYTSVDVGSLFGQTIAEQLAEMYDLLGAAEPMELVEAGAGDGRLARDVLEALARNCPSVYRRLSVVLIERSRMARGAQAPILGTGSRREETAMREASDSGESSGALPRGITGVIVANELLDALPVHVVDARGGQLREVYVDERNGALVETLGPLSTERIRSYLDRFLVDAPSVIRVEIGLAAMDWIAQAAAALDRGFILLFDYGHEAHQLYSDAHAAGTLLAHSRHTAGALRWLDSPGEIDLTAHVNLTAVRCGAESAGLEPLGSVDQGYFLMNLGVLDNVSGDRSLDAVRQRLAVRALVTPGGLGSTVKAIAFGKGVGRPALRGFRAGRQT